MMKNIFNLIVLVAAVLMAACQDDVILSQQTAKPGDEIVFNAVSGYRMDNRSSRTLYSGDTYTEGNITYERIEWEANKDIIGIYCENANNVQYADYKVTALDTEENETIDKTHHAFLARHEAHNGLHWGEGTHEFFAIYPSPTTPDQNGSATSLVGRVKLEDNVLTGYVPTTQTPIEYVNNKTVTNTSNGNTTTLRTANVWAKPDMRYSYMIARTTATPDEAHVELSFKPISTALEIDINTKNAAAEKITITSITIQSKTGKAITGNFTCPIKSDGTPDTENIKFSNTSSSLTIQLGTTGKEFNSGDVLRVTALLLPTAVAMGDLRITISGTSEFGGDQIGTLTEVSLQAHKKHYISNLPLKDRPVKGNNWISRLDNNIYLGGLSIPGAANAFSSAYTANDYKNYRTQSKTFSELWDMGVRCFELVTDISRGSSAWNSRDFEKVTNLGNASLRCNNVELGKTVDGAITQILDSLKNNSQEFAMVILTYQPTGHSDARRNPGEFMSYLRTYYSQKFPNQDAANKLELYSPLKKVEDVRGKLLIVARPSQEGEDDDNVVSEAFAGGGYEILTVKGWGSLMDKWWRRGYNTMIFKGGATNASGTAIEAIDKREGYNNYPAMEDWIYGTNFTQATSNSYGNYRPYPTQSRKTENRPTKGEIRYEYPTDQEGIRVWAQEWRRVIDWDTNKELDSSEKNITGQIRTSFSNTEDYNYLFPESYKEKKDDVEATYNKAISDTERSMVYFNSLDGFFMLEDNYDSYDPYWKGNMGNIYDYALDINKWFYNTALSKAEANGTGTMGVIIMDYIGEDLGQIPGELLPQIIYNNNFKSTLPSYNPNNGEEGGEDEGGEDEGGEDEGGFGGGSEDE